MATQHQHGSMDITQQQKTFTGFIRLATWTGVISILVLIFLALSNS